MMLCCSAVLPLPCAAAAPVETAGFDADWVLRKLARPAPMQTDFVEVRDSKLLQRPLRVTGEYRRPDADTLVREVRSPYRETTTIRAGEAVIARAGGTRTFTLDRVPELRQLQASFGALLAGDRPALERLYAIELDGTRARWALTLAPRDRQLAVRVQRLTLFGRGAELRCIETLPADGGQLQRTLMAGAARAAAGIDDDAGLVSLCRGSG